MSNWEVEDIKADMNNERLIYRYSCGTRTDINSAIKFHRQLYKKEQYQPIQIKMIQYMDWMDGGKGRWTATVSHRNSPSLSTLIT